ncbi:hypothetical protein D3C79_844810 [compost metagenome]
MHFDQDVEADALGGIGKFGHLHVIQRRNDQQHTVSAQGPGFDDLVRIDHEVLADHRQLARGARLLQVDVAALEVVDIGQHRQAGRPALLVADGDVGRNEVFADHALAWRGFVDLGNDCRLLAPGLLDQGLGKAARSIGDCRHTLELRQADPCAALGDFLNLTGENLFQNRRHTHPSFSCLNTAVKAPSSSSFSRARPVCNAS